MFLPSEHLPSAFYETFPSKNPSKNLVFTDNPYRRLLRTLLRSTHWNLLGEGIRAGVRRVKGSRLKRGPGSSCSHAQTAHSPRKPRAGTLSSWDPLPLSPSQKKHLQGGRGRGPGSWCSSGCKGSRSVGLPRAGYPPRAGTPRIFSRWPGEFFLGKGRQESFEGIVNFRKLCLFLEVILKTPPRIHCKTS